MYNLEPGGEIRPQSRPEFGMPMTHRSHRDRGGVGRLKSPQDWDRESGWSVLDEKLLRRKLSALDCRIVAFFFLFFVFVFLIFRALYSILKSAATAAHLTGDFADPTNAEQDEYNHKN